MGPFAVSVSARTRCSRPLTRRYAATAAAAGASAGSSPQRWSCCTTKITAQHDLQLQSRRAITSYAERLAEMVIDARMDDLIGPRSVNFSRSFTGIEGCSGRTGCSLRSVSVMKPRVPGEDTGLLVWWATGRARWVSRMAASGLAPPRSPRGASVGSVGEGVSDAPARVSTRPCGPSRPSAGRCLASTSPAEDGPPRPSRSADDCSRAYRESCMTPGARRPSTCERLPEPRSLHSWCWTFRISEERSDTLACRASRKRPSQRLAGPRARERTPVMSY